MNILKLTLVAIFAFCFTACIDITEEFEVRKDGSGQMNIKSDMGKLFELVKQFATDEDLQKEGMAAKDTTIQFKSLLDSTSGLSAEEKELLRDGSIHMKMNMNENLLQIDILQPFQSIEKGNKLYATMNKSGLLTNAMKGLNPNAANAPTGDSGFESIGSIYDVKLDKGSYKKSINKVRYDSLMADPKTAEARSMLDAMEEMHYNLVLKFPRPVKSVSNSKAVISEDKKTVTLLNGMKELFEKPENLEITVQY